MLEINTAWHYQWQRPLIQLGFFFSFHQLLMTKWICTSRVCTFKQSIWKTFFSETFYETFLPTFTEKLSLLIKFLNCKTSSSALPSVFSKWLFIKSVSLWFHHCEQFILFVFAAPRPHNYRWNNFICHYRFPTTLFVVQFTALQKQILQMQFRMMNSVSLSRTLPTIQIPFMSN